MKVIKYLAISLGIILILSIAIGGIFFWRYYKNEQKKSIISLVKNASSPELRRAGLARSGLWEKRKDEFNQVEKKIESNDTIPKPFTVEINATIVFEEDKIEGKAIGPLIWDAWKFEKYKWLVGCMWAELNDAGKISHTRGFYFEVRLIKDQELIQWLYHKKDDNGEYFDPLRKEYADKIEEIRKEYIKFWLE